MGHFKLYNYFRSSASYRVRLALHWKGIEFEYIPVHLVNDGGQQHSETYRVLNPMEHVPTLVDGDFALAESVAIFDYLDRIHPTLPLFPSDVRLRARTLQICEIVNSGIQPLQNLKITQDFEKRLKWSSDQATDWLKFWMAKGLSGLEKLAMKTAGAHAVGDEVTAADMFIVPQLFAARRFNIDLSQCPTLVRVDAAAVKSAAFQKAHPDKQIDAAPAK